MYSQLLDVGGCFLIQFYKDSCCVKKISFSDSSIKTRLLLWPSYCHTCFATLHAGLGLKCNIYKDAGCCQ